MRLIITILLICVTYTIAIFAQCNVSNNSTVAAICEELQRASRPNLVTKVNYTFESIRTVSSIEMTPASAFRVTKVVSPSGSKFQIEIVDASLLFKLDGGLWFPVPIRMDVLTGEVEVGTIKIDADSRCETILEFTQSGQPIDLNQVQTRFQLKWEYPASLVVPPVVNGSQVRVNRIRNGEANITLKIMDGTIEIAKATRAVQDCNSVTNLSSRDAPTIQYLTPERCWKPLRTGQVDEGTLSTYHFRAANVCTRPITCQFRTWVTHYTSQFDANEDMRLSSNSRSKMESAVKMVEVSINARVGGEDGLTVDSFTIFSNQTYNGSSIRGYWNRFTAPDSCFWSS